jgi:hypothetical protein
MQDIVAGVLAAHDVEAARPLEEGTSDGSYAPWSCAGHVDTCSNEPPTVSAS